MNLFQIIALLIANKESIVELFKLLMRLKDQIVGDNTAIIMSEEQITALAADYQALDSSLQASGQSLVDLIKYLIENGDQIVELVKKLKELIDAFT